MTATDIQNVIKRRDLQGSAAPTAGTFVVGEIVWNTAPTAAGTVGWVCTTAGSPGTWTGFGSSGFATTAAEIQAGLDAGRTVYLPPGTIDLGTTGLTIDGDGEIVGAGINATTLTYSGTAAAITVNTGLGSVTLESLVSDLTIDCEGTGAFCIHYGDAAAGSNKTGTGRLSRVRLADATTAGLYGEYVAYLYLDEIITKGTAVGAESMVGAHFDTVTGNQNTTVYAVRCRFQQCYQGLLIEDLGTSLFLACSFETNAQEGVRIDRNASELVKILKFQDCYFEGNNSDDTAGVAQFFADDDGASPSQTNVLDHCFFNSPGVGGYNMRFGVAQWAVWNCEQQTGTSYVESVSSSVRLDIMGPDDDDTKWDLVASTAASLHMTQTGNTTRRSWSNVSGAWTLYHEIDVSGSGVAWFGATVAGQQSHVVDPSGGATVDAEARTAINSILTTLETYGFHATS